MLKFKKGVNFIIGPNGIGKTSILEAIVFNLLGEVRKKNKKTFRTLGVRKKTETILKFKYEDESYELTRSFNRKLELNLSSESLVNDLESNQEILGGVNPSERTADSY